MTKKWYCLVLYITDKCMNKRTNLIFELLIGLELLALRMIESPRNSALSSPSLFQNSLNARTNVQWAKARTLSQVLGAVDQPGHLRLMP